MRPLDPAEIAWIEREHCLHHGFEAADLAFVFGNRVAAEALAALPRGRSCRL